MAFKQEMLNVKTKYRNLIDVINRFSQNDNADTAVACRCDDH